MSLSTKSQAPARVAGGKFLTFYLGSEEYAIQILKVREIIGLLPVTRIPRCPAWVCGVINLRGTVIPVVNLRLKFAMEAVEATDRTCIVVVAVEGIPMGVLVDRVSEVCDILAENIEPPPSLGMDTDFLLGVGKAGDRIRLLLDVEQVLSRPEIMDLRALNHEAK